jgi:hypothetical protein
VDKKEGYPIPYRCFYSTNVPNLFMAGRCISVTHGALGTVRVMRTCGMMGEVVGKAAYICVARNVNPRGVYQNYLPLLLDLVSQPGAMRRDTLEGELYQDKTVGEVLPYFTRKTDAVTLAAKKQSAALVKTKPVLAIDLPGIVVDDTAAKFNGQWTQTDNLQPFIGDGYRFAKGNNAEARYRFTVPKSGKYEVRLSWGAHQNRGTQVPCVIERAGQTPLKLRLDQRASSPDAKGFHSLGVFDFEGGKTNALVLSTAGARGYVHADCLQVVEATP